MSVRLKHAAASHVGLVRRLNEDSYVSRPGLYAVCDGMGGARAGEVASETACRKLLEMASAFPDQAGLRRAVRAANREIYRRSLEDPALQGMGTTLTAAVTSESGLLLAHVGDSRAYLLREGELRQLTEDHSLVAEMVRQGQLTPEQASVHPHRSIITRALGTEEEVEPDLMALQPKVGDRLLFGTDGLTGMLNDSLIAQVLGEGEDPESIAQALIEAALAAGGEDNITVLVVLAEEAEGEDSMILTAAAGAAAAAAAAGEEVGPRQRRISGRKGATGLRGDRGRRAFSGLARRDAAVRPGAAGLERADHAAGISRARARRRLILGSVLAVLLLSVGVAAFAVFNSTVYWVGAAEGNVSLYRGMPYTVLGVDLYRLAEVGRTPYATLETYVKARIADRDLLTKEEGQRFIRSLEQPDPGQGPPGGTLPGLSTTTLPAFPTTTSPTVGPTSTTTTFP